MAARRITIAEYTATTMIVTATLIVSSNIGYMALSMVLYMLGNICFAYMAYHLNRWGFFGMSIFLALVNVWGFFRWLV